MTNLLSFFKVSRPWDITWGHGINRSQKLDQYCNSPQIMMIEGDILLKKGIVVMAHDLDQPVDLTFKNWIKKVIASKKGIKLDFKDPLAVTPCLEQLQKISPKVPVFLNADILPGPGGQTPKFQTLNFTHLCQQYYPKGTVSLGWTTEYLSDTKKARYTKTMLHQALKIANKINANTSITFPIRACYLEISYSELLLLLQKPNHTLTIWNNEPVSNALKTWMKHKLNRNKTFYDLIDSHGNPLRL